MLTTGDIDNNVHPAGTLRMAEGADQGEQALRLLHVPGSAAWLRQYGRLLVLAQGRVLREEPDGGQHGMERRYQRAYSLKMRRSDSVKTRGMC